MARINRVDSSHDVGKSCKISLISYSYTTDSIGNQIKTETSRSLYATIRSVYGSEFARAGEQGLKSANIFTIWAHEYANEEELTYNSETYVVYRNYVRRDGRVELYTEKKVGIE